MENQEVEVAHTPWLVMENGRKLFARVIGLPAFTRPVEPKKTAETN